MNEPLAVAAAAIDRAVLSDHVTMDLDQFLEVLADLGRRQHSLSIDEEMFLRETSPLIRRARVPMRAAISDLEDHVGQEFYGDEWFRAADRRSRIQFVRDLYRDRVDVDWSTFMDVENVDYMMQKRGDEEGPVNPDRIPPGTPSSHWWWWYPKAPALLQV